MTRFIRDDNRVPVTGGVLQSDGVTPTPLEIDSAGNLLVNVAVGGGGGTQYTDGNAIPTHPIGNALVTKSGANWAYVSSSNPLPNIITDASGHQATVTGGKLDVNATISGTGGGTSTIDKAAFTVGSDSGTPTMGVYQASLDTVTDGHAAVAGLTNKRALFVNLQTSGGAETGVAATPLQVSIANTGANATAVKVDNSGVTQPVSGTVTVQQSTASSLKVDLSGTGANATAIKVDNSGVTQPVSGTVTANAGSGTFNIQSNASVNLAQLNAHTILETVHGTNTAGNGGLSVGMMAEFDDVAPTSITENQFGNVRMSANRNLYSTIRDAAGNERGVNVNSSNQLSVSVDNTPAVTVSGVATASNQTGGAQKTQIVDGSGNVIASTSNALNVNVANAAGTSSNFGSAFPAAGTAAGFSDGTNMQGAKVYDLDSGAGSDYVAGASLRFVASGGSTPADTNSGTKSAATLRVVLATDQPQLTNKLLVTPDANSAVNVAQINGVTPLMGNGTTGTGSQRVTIASDNTAFSVNPVSATVPVSTMNSASANSGVNSALAANFDDVAPTAISENNFGFVRMSANRNLYGTIRDAAGNERGVNVNSSNQLSVSVDNNPVLGAGSAVIGHVITDATSVTAATLSAETTKVIGTVRTADGSGNLYTSNSSTYTAKNAQDTNLLGTLGTAFSTAGKVDTKAADGDVFVRSNAASTFPVNANQSGTWTVQPGNTQNTTPWLVKPNIVTISTSITRPADTNAYAAGDAYANSTSSPTAGGYTLTGAALVSGGTGVITDAIISSSAKTNYNGELWIFDQATTALNDNAVFDVSTTNVLNLVAIIPFQTSDTNNTTAISYVTGLNVPFTCSGSANLRFLVKLLAAVTPASAEVLGIRVKVQN